MIPKRFLNLSEFSKNVLKLSSSTVVASAVGLLTLPIITNIFAISDLGRYQLLVSIIGMLGVVASLRYDMAIILPKEDSEASEIFKLSFFVLVGVTLLSAVVFYFFRYPLLTLLNAVELIDIALLIPVGVFFYGLMEIIKYGLVRKKKFSEFALVRFFQVSTTQFSAIGFGWFYPDFFTLVGSYIFGFLIASILYINKSIITVHEKTTHSIKNVALKYKKFPLINSSMVFLNTLSIELPVFFIAKYFSMEMVGLYMLANRLSIIPMNLIGTAVNKVYLQKATETFNKNPQKLFSVYKQTVKRLFLLGLIPFIIILFFAPLLVRIIFGNEWIFSGTIMQILALGVFLQFSTSPISTTFTIVNKQETALYLTIVSLAVRFGSMYYFRSEIESLLWALTLSTALFYLVYNLFTYRVILLKTRKIKNNVIK
jgi:O-antigen/teichoic acid export membrane protein